MPPSLGQQGVWELAREFADLLYRAQFSSVVPFKTYEALRQALIGGEVDAAWGPPLICADVERHGGAVALRGIRDGEVSYRSVLVCRAHDAFELDAVASGSIRPRAVWVDRWSMGGYVLPRSHLRSIGIPTSMLRQEKLLGSYAACFEALLERDAELTATFVGPKGLEAVLGDSLRLFREIARTRATPNDAVVLAPGLSESRRSALVENLEKLLVIDRSRQLLAQAFSVDGFDRPPAGTYAPLLDLLED